MSAETISVKDLYSRVAKRPRKPYRYHGLTGFTGKVTRKAALMIYYRHELWIPLATMRATFMGEGDLPDQFVEYEFSCPIEVIRDSKKYNEDQDAKRQDYDSRRYPT